MKKLLYIFICIIPHTLIIAQLDIDYGVKAGLNYNSNGDLNITGGLAGITKNIKSDKEVGYHFGVYTQLNFTKFYIKPELIYTKTKSSYSNNTPSKFTLSTLELPILVGYSIIKPISIYVGPSFQYILSNDFSSNFDLNIENDVVLGINIGASVKVSKFGFDVRYTGGLSENLAVYFDDLPVDGMGYSIDTKPNQFILSVSFQVN